MTNGIWPIHVINLADNTTRMENVRRQLDAQGLDFDRIDAVNGWKLTADEIAKFYDAKANATRHKQNLVPAEMGCYLSHIASWEFIAASEAEGGIVLEDDFAAEPDLHEVLASLCEDGQPDWDLAKLFCINASPKMIDSVPLVGRFTLGRPYRVPSTTLGYAITRDAARRLLQSSIPFFRPIDEDHKFFWEHGLRISLVQPNPIRVGAQEAETGTIGDARRSLTKEGGWRKLRYQLGYQARLRWHRMRGHP